jgi:hypothetical protein
MRRLGALLLILLFGGVPVFSALGAAALSSELPACCRKDGAHLCSVRRGQAKQDDGKTKLIALCPFAGKEALAVPGRRVGNVVAAGFASVPVVANSAEAAPQVFALASTSFLANSKRGPPSVFLQS